MQLAVNGEYYFISIKGDLSESNIASIYASKKSFLQALIACPSLVLSPFMMEPCKCPYSMAKK